MICTIPELKKISLFYERGAWPYKSIDEVKKLTGADVVINAGLYNLNTREPLQTQKVNGKYISLEDAPYVGYGWNGEGEDIKLTTKHTEADSFVSCIFLPSDSNPHYPADMGGVRGRTAFGLKADGAVVIYCSKDGTADACTPEQLRTKMYAEGCVSALMLDGGLTSQCIMPSGNIASTRNPPAYLCFWAKVYRVQVGAFWNKSGAEALKQELAGKGYPGAWIVEK